MYRIRSSVAARPFGSLARRIQADRAALTQSLIALSFSTAASLFAGIALIMSNDRIEAYPGLLLMLPAASGLKGMTSGALAGRLGTAVHMGTFQRSLRSDSVVGQNVRAGLVLSLTMTTATAVLAKVGATAFGISPTMTLTEFISISVIGGLVASAITMLVAVFITELSVARQWDADNVTAPLITSVGDILTVPTLIFATRLADHGYLTDALGIGCGVVAVIVFSQSWRSQRPILRRIVHESVAILGIGALLDIAAGSVVDGSSVFDIEPGLLVLLPAFLAVTGALGAMLSNRLTTKLHLGLVDPHKPSFGSLSDDLSLMYLTALPLYLGIAFASVAAAHLVDMGLPNVTEMLLIVFVAGAVTVTLGAVAAVGATFATYRLGLDPDNYGVPFVTSTVDLCGATALVVVISAAGIVG
ncbi:MAG: magnesium transporter [Actinobacteria bacterium]|nr:magnesium transporter [Actinomycetota bacterium]MCB9390388.1 magnesium transporter [Acidimicrobiia bacterium]